MTANPSITSEDDEYRKAVTKYSARFMSNSKWLKLFRAVICSKIAIERAQWCFLDSSHSVWLPFPSERDLLPTRFQDGMFQPFEYRWLESVFIPHRFKPIEGVGYEREQDTKGILSALAAVGQFPIEETAEGLRIYGYRK